MIANNRAKDWLKKSKPVFFTDISGTEEEDNVSFEESIEDVRSDMNPEMSMDEKEVRRLVMEILDQLPEDQRIVIGMFYYEEMPVKDIAAALEVSENTVKSRLSYGRKKIKEQVLDLEKHGTKLYNVAPFVFFLYLLRRVDSVSAEPLDPDALQGILNSCSGGISGKQLTWGKPDPDSNLQNGQNVQGGTGAEGSAGNSWNRTDAYGDNGNSWSDTGISENRRNPQSSTDGYGDNRNNWGNTGASGNERKAAGAAAKAGTAKTAGGAAAKFAGIKIAALILAGSLGAGGITYGIVRNADTLPFVHEQKVKDTSDSAKGTEKRLTQRTQQIQILHPTQIKLQIQRSLRIQTEHSRMPRIHRQNPQSHQNQRPYRNQRPHQCRQKIQVIIRICRNMPNMHLLSRISVQIQLELQR